MDLTRNKFILGVAFSVAGWCIDQNKYPGQDDKYNYHDCKPIYKLCQSSRLASCPIFYPNN